jgi:ubiquinone/menaquinone biosynthesis C-methylase UbiE
MDLPINHRNEKQVQAAFNGQSLIFDDLYSKNEIIRYKRNRVRQHLMKYLPPASDILELNAGTGEDAIFLARQGHRVHATDISSGMQLKLSEKLGLEDFAGSVSQELCSFTALDGLQNKGPFDCIFSNFAGLNCTGNLEQVLLSMDPLLKPGGLVVLVILPKFCFWESLFILKGKFKTATRRFFSSKGRRANIDGATFNCWYYSSRFIKRTLKEKFDLLDEEGLCCLVPPSYVEKFPDKYPGLYSWLCKQEERLKRSWPWKYIGDYYIISFRKTGKPSSAVP